MLTSKRSSSSQSFQIPTKVLSVIKLFLDLATHEVATGVGDGNDGHQPREAALARFLLVVPRCHGFPGLFGTLHTFYARLFIVYTRVCCLQCTVVVRYVAIIVVKMCFSLKIIM